ncbi:protein MAIN-LIKE 2-like [Telopea speciosissima]|uniref:protein MAIN-LIKE 2-like n=1 Tax=Telopea speciosissima TaxID=54955 RepID=UPI001CC3E02B|nr:protein MAIN-LIKE 2-like [Telopea speciosissima]
MQTEEKALPMPKKYCGTVRVREWYSELYPEVQSRVRRTGLGHIATCPIRELDSLTVRALVERWWPSTHTFDLPLGEVTITPLDFYMIMGLPFGGAPVTLAPADRVDRFTYWGRMTGLTVTQRGLPATAMRRHWKEKGLTDQSPSEEHDQMARCFLLYLLAEVVFSDMIGTVTVNLAFCRFLEDFDAAAELDWGGSAYAHLLYMLGSPSLIGCSYVIWTWSYEREQDALLRAELEKQRLEFERCRAELTQARVEIEALCLDRDTVGDAGASLSVDDYYHE